MFRTLIYLVFCYCFVISIAQANTPPKISIIIDDLGNDEIQGMHVVHLPGPVVCSILPQIRYSKVIANACHAAHKEIILHTPMQADTPHRLGPGGLRVNMTKEEFLATLKSDLCSVPFIAGLNNHMGSLLTAQDTQMNWLMETIKPRGLYFIDSVTSAHSIAGLDAEKEGVPTRARDVFLDDIPTQAAVEKQFNALLVVARRQGSAIAIGHPYPATVAVLAHELPRLTEEGFTLVPVSQLLDAVSVDVRMDKNMNAPELLTQTLRRNFSILSAFPIFYSPLLAAYFIQTFTPLPAL